jgi:hypothetical protein
MIRFQIPTSFSAGRAIVLLGTAYDRGADVPIAVARTLRNLGGLVSRRILVPNAPQSISHVARQNETPRPESYPTSIRGKL